MSVILLVVIKLLVDVCIWKFDGDIEIWKQYLERVVNDISIDDYESVVI